MKKIYFIMIALIVTLVVSAQTIEVYEYDSSGNLNNTPAYTSSKKVKVIFRDNTEQGSESIDSYEYVDLGLPSGTLWATCNVGANSPEDYGDYFAWGETTPKSSYNRSNYKWFQSAKYDSTYGRQVLDSEDDAATVNWGIKWCMPTIEQFDELFNSAYTTNEWTTQNGINGRKITSKTNGKSIFLPAADAGKYVDTDTEFKGTLGYYWSRSNDLSSYDRAMGKSFYFYDIFNDSSFGCSRGYSVRPVRIVEISSITLNKSSLSLYLGNNETLSATVTPETAEYKSVTWSSSDETIAAVDQNGLVVAKGIGSAIITATANDGSGVKATCNVSVIRDIHEYVDLGLPSGTLWATCNIGANSPEEYGDYFAWGEIEPMNETRSGNKWYNEDKQYTKYCTDSKYGIVDNKTELAPEDDAATANWGNNWCMPTSKQLDELFNSTTYEWTTLNGVYGCKITSKTNGNSIFLPAARDYNEQYDSYFGTYGAYWSRSLNSKLCGFAWPRGFNSDGSIFEFLSYGMGRGDGYSVRPVRYVAVSEISLNKSLLFLYLGNDETLTATMSPVSASYKTITWSSSDETIATVDQNGKVTAKSVGSVTITVSATDGSGVKATCKVYVSKLYVNSITLNYSSLTIGLGKYKYLTATVTPATATDGSITWSSSDETIATVDQYGKVTINGIGSATITATANDGSGVKATCTVNGIEITYVETLTLDKSSLSLSLGSYENLTAYVTPSTATDKSVTWSSSNSTIASVNQNGKVTANGVGSATITVTANDGSGAKATCSVNVTNSSGGSGNSDIGDGWVSVNVTGYHSYDYCPTLKKTYPEVKQIDIGLRAYRNTLTGKYKVISKSVEYPCSAGHNKIKIGTDTHVAYNSLGKPIICTDQTYLEFTISD